MFSKKKQKGYFQGRVEEATHGKREFSVDDNVKILPSSPKFPLMYGIIRKMVHGNFGDGRIFAEVEVNEGFVVKTSIKVPLGRLRKVK